MLGGKGIWLECASLAALQVNYADLFTATTMRSFFVQSDHLKIFLTMSKTA